MWDRLPAAPSNNLNYIHGGWYDPVGTGMTLRLIMVPSPFDVQIEE